jgi:hypothetical protein
LTDDLSTYQKLRKNQLVTDDKEVSSRIEEASHEEVTTSGNSPKGK